MFDELASCTVCVLSCLQFQSNINIQNAIKLENLQKNTDIVINKFQVKIRAINNGNVHNMKV